MTRNLAIAYILALVFFGCDIQMVDQEPDDEFRRARTINVETGIGHPSVCRPVC